jgi:hypothetical protein
MGLPQFFSSFLLSVFHYYTVGDSNLDSIPWDFCWQNVCTSIRTRFALLDSDDSLKLLAYAISGRIVRRLDKFNAKFTFEGLEMNGLCTIVSDGSLFVPHCFLYIVDSNDPTPLGKSNLSFLGDVDANFLGYELWQLWERFCAHHECMKRNALAYLNIAECDFHDFHRGALISTNLSDLKIIPKAVEFFHCSDQLGPTTNLVRKFDNRNTTVSWDSRDHVFLNGVGGAGIDAWSSDKSFSIFVQCKFDSATLTQKEFEALVEKAVKVIPSTCERYAFGLYCHSKCSPMVKVPENCFVVSRRCFADYFGMFNNYAILSTSVYINDPMTKQTWIESIMTDKTNSYRYYKIRCLRKISGFVCG